LIYRKTLYAVVCLCLFATGAMGQTRFETRVRLIHAAAGPAHVDPGISDLAPDLTSVFKYSAYRLIESRQMTLEQGQTGRVALPDNQVLILQPQGMDKGRIAYQIVIQKQQTRVFETQILLKNHSSITIGGPKFESGVLLMNISGTAR
jgi:hypothetical protein